MLNLNRLDLSAHHEYESPLSYKTPFHPVKSGDTFRVFHAFRDIADAVKSCRTGLSGATPANRAYSYEFDNNPKGLFVTLDSKVAKEFGATIIEFTAKLDELEAPVWPGGGYTVQGQMAQYFGRGVEGRRKRNTRKQEAEKETENDPALNKNHPHLAASDKGKKYLAELLTVSSEYQALFIGHLNPSRIMAVYTCDTNSVNSTYTKHSVKDFLEGHADMESRLGKVYLPDDVFNGENFIKRMTDHYGKIIKDMNEALKNMWRRVKSLPPNKRAGEFVNAFDNYLWPKQYAPALRWMNKVYSEKSDKARLFLNRLDNSAVATWWQEFSPDGQKEYISEHPRSKYSGKESAEKAGVAKEEDFTNTLAAQREELVRNWNGIFKIKPATFTSHMFDKNVKVEYSPPHSDIIDATHAVGMTAHNKDFDIFRVIKKMKDGKLCVEHASFKISEKKQGKNIAKKIMRKHFAEYKKMGVDKITLFANVDVGAYAWAKYGFTPKKSEWERIKPAIQKKIDKFGAPNSGLAIKFKTPEDQQLATDTISKILASDDPKSMWKLADLNMPVQQWYDDTTLGKAMLIGMGHAWDGELDMHDKEATDRFTNYVGKDDE